MILLVYVDDIILTGSSPSLLDDFVTQLGIQFSIKDLCLLHYFLGVQVQPFHGGIFLSQAKYMADLLLNTRMIDCKPSPTPMAFKQPHLANHDDLFPDITEYRRIVGTLQYLTLTRLDLCYAVNNVCQHMHAPTYGHFQMVKHILRYVKGTISLGLRIAQHSSFDLYAFSDADWAGCPTTRCSTTGFCTFLGSNCIS